MGFLWLLGGLFFGAWFATVAYLKGRDRTGIEQWGGGFIVAIVVFGFSARAYFSWQDSRALDRAQAAGFSSVDRYEQALKSGYETKAEADAAARRAVEIKNQEMAAEKMRENAEQEKAREDREAACLQDVTCRGERFYLKATVKCQPLIEQAANYDYKWIDGFWGSKMTRMSYLRGDVYRYSGDQIKMQNGLGAWQRHSYYCDYDVAKDRVLNLQVKLGRVR